MATETRTARTEEQLTTILQRLDLQKEESDRRDEEQERRAHERHHELQHDFETEVAGLRESYSSRVINLKDSEPATSN